MVCIRPRWLISGWLITTAVQADPVAEAVRFEYQSVPPCADEAEFHRRLAARKARYRAAREGEPVRIVTVAIGRGKKGFWGSLRVGPVGAASTEERQIEATDCAALVDALSLMTVLALNPESGGAQDSAPAPADADNTVPPRITDVGTVRLPVAPAAPRLPAGATPLRRAPARLRVGGQLVGHWGIVPSGLYGVEVFGDLISAHRELRSPQRWVASPMLRLGLRYLQSPTREHPGGLARFQFMSARLEACPLAWERASGWRVASCLVGDFGGLAAQGSDTEAPQSDVRWWGAFGGGLGISIPLVTGFTLESNLALEAPVRRDKYMFGEQVFYRMHPLLLASGIGVAWFVP